MEYLLQGFGVFLGVLAGTGVTLLTQWVVQKRSEIQKLRNLKFEFRLNIKKIERWLEELTAYRNAVNSETLGSYFGTFDLSRSVFVTFNNMFYSGLLYKYLNHDDIGKLQVLVSEFTPAWENFINNQIMFNRTNFDKPRAAMDVNYWEWKFKDHRKTLDEILRKLQ